MEQKQRKIRYPELIKIEWVEILEVPFNIRIVEHGVVERNNQEVLVLRFQRLAPKEFDTPYLAFTLCELSGRLISYVNRMLPVVEHTISEDDALLKATLVLRKIDPEHFEGLSFVRIDKPERQFVNIYGEIELHPIYWVKFKHSNGGFSWVGLSMSGQVEEYEIDSMWDYENNRRKTEMWDHDGWVKARYGLGPELDAPAALARG